MYKALLVAGVLSSLSLAQAATYRLNCRVDGSQTVTRGGVSRNTEVLSQAARGVLTLDNSRGTVRIVTSNGNVIAGASFAPRKAAGEELYFLARMNSGSVAGSYLVGIMRKGRMDLTFMPPPRGVTTYSIACAIP